jgi:4-amino-4-deoxy-L-arabinose transferase-like glycosyltransferase
MDELARTGPPDAAQPSGWRRDLALVALLLVLATGIRAWVVGYTQVPARDSIGFIRYALWLEEEGWSWALTHAHQHPGYPLSVLAVAAPVRHYLGQDCDTMQLSAQLASALAGVLLVLPMYFLGKLLLDRSAGFWGALLFQCLPNSGHALSDALSDPLFLLLLATALLFAMQAVRRRAPWRFAVAGVWCGLAYLTRPEGALVLAATGLVVLSCQLLPAWRQPWRRVLRCGAAMTLAALIVGSPYFLTTGCFTNKPSFYKITGTFEEKAERAEDLPPEAARPAPPGPLLAAVWATWLHDEDSQLPWRLGDGLWAVGALFVQCYQYVGWLPVLIGVWWYTGRYRRMPEAWVLILLFWMDFVVLWRLAVVESYLSDRHVMVLVLCTVFQAVAVVRELPYRLAAWWRRPAGARRRWLSAPAWSLLLLLALTGVGLSKTLQPLHGNRAGHRAAGRWLAAHAHPGDAIDDDHCWAHYYAGWVFLERKEIPRPADARRFVVINRSNEKKQPSHLPTLPENEVRRQGGRVVYHWPENRPADAARVLVYVMAAPGRAHP